MSSGRRFFVKGLAVLGAGALASRRGFASQADGGSAAGAFVDYSARDHEIVDYNFFALPSSPDLRFRGPPFYPDKNQDFFSCIGASQTLGVLVEKPFPTLLSEKLGIPVLNLGLGGGTPGFFARHPELIEVANRGRFVILQIMAARSESNDRFQALPMAEMVRDSKRGDIISAPLAWDRIFREERNNAATYVRQSTAQWENEYRALLQAIKVPIILFWFSPKRLDEPVDFGAADTRAFLGKFPQFITGRNVDALRPFQGRFITCFSDRNMGQPLVSRFTGQPVEIDYGLLRGLGVTTKEKNNNYYPSSDMHIDAAQALFPAVREILG